MDTQSYNDFQSPKNNTVKGARTAISCISLSLIMWLLFSLFVASPFMMILHHGIIPGIGIVLEFFGVNSAQKSFDLFLNSELWFELYSGISYLLTQGFLLFVLNFFIKKNLISEFHKLDDEKTETFGDSYFYLRLIPLFAFGLALSLPFSSAVSMFTGIETIAGKQVSIPGENIAFFTSFVFSCIVPPFFEEYTFRKVILSNLLPYGKSFAIFVTAVFFAIPHVNAIAIASAFVIGLIIGVIAVKSESIVPCIFFHMLNNIVAFIQTALAEFYPQYSETTNMVFMLLTMLIGLASLIVLFGGKKKFWRTDDDIISSGKEKTSERDIFSAKVFVNPLFVILILSVILFDLLQK